MKLNKTIVDALLTLLADKGQVFYWDAELPGFGMYIGKTAKTWCVQQRITNKTKRVVLGKYPTMTAEQARNTAKKRIGELAAGIDPVKLSRENKVKAIHLVKCLPSS